MGAKMPVADFRQINFDVSIRAQNSRPWRSGAALSPLKAPLPRFLNAMGADEPDGGRGDQDPARRGDADMQVIAEGTGKGSERRGSL